MRHSRRADLPLSLLTSDAFLEKHRKDYIPCPVLHARMHWTECVGRHRRRPLRRSFGQKVTGFVTPQDKTCRFCRIGAVRSQLLSAIQREEDARARAEARRRLAKELERWQR